MLGYRPIGDRPLLFYSGTLLGVGTQLVCLGVLAEMVTAYSIRETDTFSVAETLEPIPDPEFLRTLRARRTMDDPADPDRLASPGSAIRVALIVIAAATAQSLGVALRIPTQLTANDISRYCTVWSLLERGTYAIDDCPWQKDTQDKVKKARPVLEAKKIDKYNETPPPSITIRASRPSSRP